MRNAKTKITSFDSRCHYCSNSRFKGNKTIYVRFQIPGTLCYSQAMLFSKSFVLNTAVICNILNIQSYIHMHICAFNIHEHQSSYFKQILF